MNAGSLIMARVAARTANGAGPLETAAKAAHWILLFCGLCLCLLALWQAAHFPSINRMLTENRELKSALEQSQLANAQLNRELEQAQGGSAMTVAERKGDILAISWGVQLASYADEAMARRAWAAMHSQPGFRELSGRISNYVGNGGNLYRLMAGPFPDADAAREFCARLASGSLNCTPARFTGADAD